MEDETLPVCSKISELFSIQIHPVSLLLLVSMKNFLSLKKIAFDLIIINLLHWFTT